MGTGYFEWGREVSVAERIYYKSNRERILADKRRYYKRNRKKILASKRLYHELNSRKICSKKRRYYRTNRRRVLARNCSYFKNNREKVRVSRLLWRKNNPEKARAQRHLWAKNNPDKVRESTKRWLKSGSPKAENYRISNLLRRRILGALTGKTKAAHTLELLGCSIEQFREHLQKQFRSGMQWNNHGSVWEIDHKLPCASFDLSDPSQQRKCFHYSNMQPLFKQENREKRDKILYE